MIFFTPKWKKEAKLTIKGANKFINYKRDLLDETQIKNIKERQLDVKKAVATKDGKEVKKKCNLLEQECKRSLTSYTKTSWIAENTEVFFVAIVIALGLRAYALQPFRIPTGSMRPSLNGLNGHILDKSEWPNIAQRTLEGVTYGRSYISLTSEKDDNIIGVQEGQTAKFFTRTTVYFENQSPQSFSCSLSSLTHLGFSYDFERNEKGQYRVDAKGNRIFAKIPVTANVPVVEGFVDSGDMVLVDKVSYHFRKPKRGETFVFDTRNIEKIHARASKEQPAGSHYIKRLVGVPGDSVSIDKDGHIYIDGKIAKDDGLEYAMKLSGFGRREGHTGYTLLGEQDDELNYVRSNRYTINRYGEELVLTDNKEKPQLSEYAAFGDNTVNSSDSRDWGKVRQYNLVGPAFLSIWPFFHEDLQHWGPIK